MKSPVWILSLHFHNLIIISHICGNSGLYDEYYGGSFSDDFGPSDDTVGYSLSENVGPSDENGGDSLSENVGPSDENSGDSPSENGGPSDENGGDSLSENVGPSDENGGDSLSENVGPSDQYGGDSLPGNSGLFDESSGDSLPGTIVNDDDDDENQPLCGSQERACSDPLCDSKDLCLNGNGCEYVEKSGRCAEKKNLLDNIPDMDAEELLVFEKMKFPDAPKIIIQDYEDFKKQFPNKDLTEKERMRRKETFDKQKKEIDEHNKLVDEGIITLFRRALNKFSDLLYDEFIKDHTGYSNGQGTGQMESDLFEAVSSHDKFPKAFDWRSFGAVTPPKDQGQCGSCWTFSAAGAIEGAVYLETMTLLNISTQQIGDCSQETDLCDGGWPWMGMQWLSLAGGMATETQYPYGAKSQTCSESNSKSAKISGFVKIKNDEDAIKEALVSRGPLSVAFHVTDAFKDWDWENNTIFKNTTCTTDPNHAVVLIGYGEDEGTPYWTLKNSWGDWAADGFFKMMRGNNLCGIEQYAYSPTPPKIDCDFSPGCYYEKQPNVAFGEKDSIRECNAWCQKEPACRGWTFKESEKTCWLHFRKLCQNCKHCNNDKIWSSGTRGCLDTDLP